MMPMQRTNLDMEVLRTFVAGVDLGSFARAAERLARSPSAVSAQLKKLEEQAGAPLFQKAGRGLALTEAGEQLLGYARRLLDLNDEAVAALRAGEIAGQVRLGLQEDFAEALLPSVLGRFARTHARLRVEARVSRNADLIERVVAGTLDLALLWGEGLPIPHAERVAELPMVWLGAADERLAWRHSAPLPLASFEAPCLFRSVGVSALDAAGIAWWSAFTSPSLSGLWAATAAGIGVMVRTPLGLPASLRVLDARALGLPALPSIALTLCIAEARPAPAVAQLAELLRTTVADWAPMAGAARSA